MGYSPNESCDSFEYWITPKGIQPGKIRNLSVECCVTGLCVLYISQESPLPSLLERRLISRWFAGDLEARSCGWVAGWVVGARTRDWSWA